MKTLIIGIFLFVVCCSTAPRLPTEHASASLSSPNTSPIQDQAAYRLAPIARQCFESSGIREKAELQVAIKPNYLTGDFDGDGIGDVALVIKGLQTRRNGIVICTARGISVFGADQPSFPPFSDMANDNFVSSQWEVMSKEEAHDVRKSVDGRRVQIAFPRGDSIAMVWEDAICLIYWDGGRYKWACGE
jgi:hypothetical protein